MSDMIASPESKVARLGKRVWTPILRIFSPLPKDRVAEAREGYEALNVTEIKALVRFVSERGIAVEPETLGNAYKLLNRLDEENLAPDERDTTRGELLGQYMALTKTTYGQFGVNGRTIRDSAQLSSYAVTQAGSYFLIFFGLAIVPNFVFWQIGEADPAFAFVNGLTQLSSFFWGGVGASVFLLKSLSELAADSRFDARRLQGVGTRVFLGAAVGYIVVEVLHLGEVLTESGDEFFSRFRLENAALAFVAGLGVKAVYGILEAIIEGVHRWVRQPKPR